MLVFRKALLALTGLFLCLFLTVHLGGNLILLLPEGQARPLYNAYSAALAGNPFIKVIAYVNYACFILHIIYGLVVSLRNRATRQERYRFNDYRDNSSWTSHNMGLLGSMLFVFVVIHLANFWFKVKFSDSDGDLYQMVVDLFAQPAYALIYAAAMIPLGLHLSHGFSSAFRSLGLYQRRYLSWIDRFGSIYSALVSLAFALIPLIIFLRVRS